MTNPSLPSLLPALELGKVLYEHHWDINIRMKRLVARGKFRDVTCISSGRWKKYFFTKRQAHAFNALMMDEERKEAGRKFINDFFSRASSRATPPAAESPAPSAAPPQSPMDKMVDLGSASFDGDDLHCFHDEKGQGFVTVSSVCLPFGKDASYEVKCIQEEFAALPPDEPRWADLRVTRGLAADGSVREVWVINVEAVPLLIASFSPRGMTPERIIKHTRYKRECAKVLFDYCARGVASNPRFSEEQRNAAHEEDNERLARVVSTCMRPVVDAMNNTLTVLSEKHDIGMINISARQDGVERELKEIRHQLKETQPVVVNGNTITGSATVMPKNPRGSTYITMSELNNRYGFKEGATFFRDVGSAFGFIGDLDWGRWSPVANGSHGHFDDNWEFSTSVETHMGPMAELYKRRINELTLQGYRRGVEQMALGQVIGSIQRMGTGTAVYLSRNRNNRGPRSSRQRHNNRFQDSSRTDPNNPTHRPN